MATPCVDKLADDQLDLGSGVVGGTTLSWPSLLHHRVISEASHPEPCCHAPLLQTTMSGKMKVRWPAFEESDASMKGRSRKDKSNYKNNVHKPTDYRIVWNCLFGGVFCKSHFVCPDGNIIFCTTLPQIPERSWLYSKNISVPSVKGEKLTVTNFQ